MSDSRKLCRFWLPSSSSLDAWPQTANRNPTGFLESLSCNGGN
uniref:Uncharacterized protein n=1 Tax=Anguilla anguilla TaxID=7936 RepID=A0A0E9REG4_ANGAN